MIDKISFTSNINFVNMRGFHKEARRCPNYIWFDEYGSKTTPICIKAPTFYSCGVKTCTGGGITDTTGKAVGFHIWDTENNWENIDLINEEILKTFDGKPLRGLLIGSKDFEEFEYSSKIFNKMKEFLSKHVPNLTIFQSHSKIFGETDFLYNVFNDSWTLKTIFFEKLKNRNAIANFDDIKNCYKNIHIADGDKLFINGKEIKID